MTDSITVRLNNNLDDGWQQRPAFHIYTYVRSKIRVWYTQKSTLDPVKLKIYDIDHQTPS